MRTQNTESGRLHTIYVLGLGSIGCFIAHSLRSLPNSPAVTLLLHRESLYHEFQSKGSTISLKINEGGAPEPQSGFGCEAIDAPNTEHPQPTISCLILAVKASATVSALQPIKHRLGKHTTICLFQNGRGQDEDLNERLFPNPTERPTFVFGIMQHGVYLTSPFEGVLAGTIGSASVGVVGGPREENEQTPCRFLLDTLTSSSILRCTELNWPELQRVQLLKLAANCVLNPLTALLDVRNGALLDNPPTVSLRRSLLEEISNVFRNLPEFRDSPSDQSRFSVSSLEEAVVVTIKKTAGNSSSMREDIRKGRATEIQFINGWIVRQGMALGIECPSNKLLADLILAKSFNLENPVSISA